MKALWDSWNTSYVRGNKNANRNIPNFVFSTTYTS